MPAVEQVKAKRAGIGAARLRSRPSVYRLYFVCAAKRRRDSRDMGQGFGVGPGHHRRCRSISGAVKPTKNGKVACPPFDSLESEESASVKNGRGV
jgi:hypothetical protein